MGTKVPLFVYFFSFFYLIKCGYPPTGDEVQPGSVLLPASRRGRYLANIVRRQAVDGTGIKFNKDADRMNAEAKKKVDVLSEELLPYIIAEQERRTTLHRRVMTAIQNGEKGVTVAEIRNKPPLIIRKGLMYRCPANRAPKEPDGSGVLGCEDDITPTQVMYDSCLSAEDKELYNADTKYFFCNRHKIEGPDLPRNGSTVIGCAPIERTSLNYTTSKCTLEDTDDVVVHYRYYPDRTYKYVTELDPDHEVCDHWNPCQIGYIYSLPSPDMATPASELWPEVREKPEEYERDEIVPAVPEDSAEEYVHPSTKGPYNSSPRTVKLPGNNRARRSGQPLESSFVGIRMKDSMGGTRKLNENHYSSHLSPDRGSVTLTLTFSQFRPIYFGAYYAVIRSASTGRDVMIKFLTIVQSSVLVQPRALDCIHGQRLNSTVVPYKCNRCRLTTIMIRGQDQSIYNADTSRFRVTIGSRGKQAQAIEIDMENPKPQDFGDYFAIFQNGDGQEERVKILTVRSPEKDVDNLIQISRFEASYEVGEHYDTTISYKCESCDLTDILCNGESVLAAGRVSIVSVTKMISFNFPRFEDAHSCVYLGLFKHKDKVYTKVLAVIENKSPAVKITNQPKMKPPQEGEQWQQEINFICEDCNVDKVYVNGIKLETGGAGSVAYFVATSSAIDIRIPAYTDTYLGVYQAKFQLGEETCTKNIMELLDEGSTSESSTVAGGDEDQTKSDGAETTEGGGGESTSVASVAPEGETTAAPTPGPDVETTATPVPEGEEPKVPSEGGNTPAQVLADATDAGEAATAAPDAVVTEAVQPAEGETPAP